MDNLRKIFSLVLITVLTAMLVVGCSSKDTEKKESKNSNDSKIAIEHELGTTEIQNVPENIVVLEYSFVDALAALDVKPIGIADDNKKNILIQPIAEKVGTYTSVGTRSQPNLEVISSLKPDLIIADLKRHKATYEQLSKIAPTIVLKSLESSYDENISAFKTIAKAINKEEVAETRLKEHNELISELRSKAAFDETKKVLLAAVREDSFNAHGSTSFTGALLEKIGLKNAVQKSDSAYAEMTLEQLVQVDPDVLFLMRTSDQTLVDEWQKNTLWNGLKAVKSNKVFIADRNLWTRFRGVISGEEISKEAVKFITEGQ